MDALVDGPGANRTIAARRHTLDVASSAKAFARTGKDDASDVGFESRQFELARQRLIHRARHGVANLRGFRVSVSTPSSSAARRSVVPVSRAVILINVFPIHVAQTKIIQFAVDWPFVLPVVGGVVS